MANWRPAANNPYGSYGMEQVDYDPNWFVNPGDYGSTYNYGYPHDMLYANWWDARNRNPQMEGDIQTGIQQSRANQGRYQRAGDQAYASGGIDPLTGNYRFDAGSYQPGQIYSPAEQEQMARENQLYGGMTTPDQFNQWGLQPDEISSIMGDPYAGMNYFNPVAGNIYTDQDFTEQRGFDRLNEAHRNIRGDIGQYQRGAQGLLDSGGGRIRGTLDQGETGVRGTYNDPRLSVSGDFMQNYQFGDKDITDLETQAGRAVGARYQGAMNDLEMQAAANDITNPLGVAALKERYLRESAAEGADAQVGARVAGRGLQLATTKGREDTRLGAEQTRAGMALEGELNLSGRRTAAEQRLLDQGLATEADLARMRMEGEQYLGTTALNENRELGAMRQLNNRYIGATGSQLAMAGDAAATGRARDIANNRQQTARDVDNTRYQQNFQTQGMLGDRYRDIANQRLDFEKERRGYLAGNTGMYYQGGLTGQGQQVGAYGARTGAQNTAGGNYARDWRTGEELELARRNSPTGLERGIAAGLGVLSGGLSGYRGVTGRSTQATADQLEGLINPATGQPYAQGGSGAPPAGAGAGAGALNPKYTGGSLAPKSTPGMAPVKNAAPTYNPQSRIGVNFDSAITPGFRPMPGGGGGYSGGYSGGNTSSYNTMRYNPTESNPANANRQSRQTSWAA